MDVSFLEPAMVPVEAYFGLAESTKVRGVDAVELAQKVSFGDLKMFVVRHGRSSCYMVVSVLEYLERRELQLDGLWLDGAGEGWRFRTYLQFLTKLAKEWKCWRVVTDVHNTKQLRGLIANGCKVDYVAVSLEIDDGLEENH